MGWDRVVIPLLISMSNTNEEATSAKEDSICQTVWTFQQEVIFSKKLYSAGSYFRMLWDSGQSYCIIIDNVAKPSILRSSPGCLLQWHPSPRPMQAGDQAFKHMHLEEISYSNHNNDFEHAEGNPRKVKQTKNPGSWILNVTMLCFQTMRTKTSMEKHSAPRLLEHSQ